MAVPVASNIPGIQLGIGYISENDSQDSHERQNVLGVSEASAVIGEIDVSSGICCVISREPSPLKNTICFFLIDR